MNLNHDAPNGNQLQLTTPSRTFRFIWVALTDRCTIAKIDTESGAILGEYRTLSDGTPCAQSSRTTVSTDGSVWVGHRGGGDRVTHVALAELNGCLDRNGNGTIETSTGYGDVKPWPGAGAPVSDAQDECILHHLFSGGGGDSRHMSVDKDGNLWMGNRDGGSVFRKYDGQTGALLVGPLDFACGGYGGLIDSKGVVWSATSGGSILRFDTALPVDANNPRCLPFSNYGMAIDSTGNVWVSTAGEGIVRKFSPAGDLLGAFPQGHAVAQGLAVDGKGDVWISSSIACGGGCGISHLRNDGSMVGTVPTPTGSGSTGVSIDAAGKVWTANYNSSTAVRIDPAAGPVVGGTPLGQVDLTVDFPAGPDGRPLAHPYNYSDMTGQQLFSSTAPQGSWTVVQDGGVLGTEWGQVVWNTEAPGTVPPGASLIVEARAADTEAALGSRSYAAVQNGATFAMVGRFLQVRATLKPDADGKSPVLSDIRIRSVPKITVSIGDVTVVEGDAGPTDATFTVSLSEPAGAAGVTVSASTAGLSALSPADYVARTNATVSFAAGEQSKPFTVQVVGDRLNEPTETFAVNLGAPVNAGIDDDQGVATIVDDDRNGGFACRASAVRLGSGEPLVANEPFTPCTDGGRTLSSNRLFAGWLLAASVNAQGLGVTTDQTPDDLESTSPSTGDSATATASVATVRVVIAGLTVDVTSIQSQASVRCVPSVGGGLVPALSGSSRIAGLRINGLAVDAGGSASIAFLGLTLQVNGTATTATSITQTALRVSAPLVPAIIIGEARAGFSGNPCAE
ncbi:MAG: Calx-beta domain-containing protein [Acidimicrobiales bacterium]